MAEKNIFVSLMVLSEKVLFIIVTSGQHQHQVCERLLLLKRCGSPVVKQSLHGLFASPMDVMNPALGLWLCFLLYSCTQVWQADTYVWDLFYSHNTAVSRVHFPSYWPSSHTIGIQTGVKAQCHLCCLCFVCHNGQQFLWLCDMPGISLSY